MDDCNTAVGHLSDLQKLDEAGRDRVLSRLFLEDLRGIIKICLRERDATSDNVASQDEPYGREHLGITCQTDVDYLIEDTQREDGNSAKRFICEPIHRRCKQPKVEEGPQGPIFAGKEIIEIDNDKEIDKSMGLDEYDPSKARPKESSLQESSIDNIPATRPAQQGMGPKLLPMSLFLGDRYTTNKCSSIECLPTPVGTELRRRFDNMWSANEHTIARYTEYTNNPGKYKSRVQCIHTMMVHGSSADDPIHQVAKEPELSAGSKCIAAGYPCARLRWHKDHQEFFICFMPLLASLRRGKSWDELGYWVLPEADATGVTTAC